MKLKQISTHGTHARMHRKIKKNQAEIERLKRIIGEAEDKHFEGKLDPEAFKKGKAKYSQKIADLALEIIDWKGRGGEPLE